MAAHDFKREGSRAAWRWRRLPWFAHVTESASFHINGTTHFGANVHRWGAPVPGTELCLQAGRWECCIGRYAGDRSAFRRTDASS